MKNTHNIEISPSIKIDPQELFGVSCEFEIYKFEEKSEHVPEIDKSYILIKQLHFQFWLVFLPIEEY